MFYVYGETLTIYEYKIISKVVTNNHFDIIIIIDNVEDTIDIIGNHNINMDNKDSIIIDFVTATSNICIILMLILFHLSL